MSTRGAGRLAQPGPMRTIAAEPLQQHGSKRSAGLPPDIQDASIRRVGYIAGISAVMMVLSLISTAFYFGSLGIAQTSPMIVARVLAVVIATLVFFTSRSQRLSMRLRADLGIAFEVALAWILAVLEVSLFALMEIPVGVISMVAIWILFIRLVIPMSTKRAIIASGLSALAVPSTALLRDHLGIPSVDPLVMGGMIKTVMAVAAVAVVASRSMYRMGKAVTEARAMGAYQLEELLGRGGMGEVWRASHQMLRRPAAIKLIRPDALGPVGSAHTAKTLQRFEREAQATARLHSVHTVQVYDFGRTEDGKFYFVMELLDGLDMESLVERFGPVRPERAMYFMRQMCHSLADAHAHGLIHRDIKPSNAFVCRLGHDVDFVKLLDFGLVLEAAEVEGSARLTAEGAITGTPAYMAPEMVLGQTAGPYTDIYMLGCVAYFLLSGQLVFEGPTAMAIISQHISTPPPPLGERCELEVPEQLEELIMRCLAKDPADRPQDAWAVVRALDAIEQPNPWTPERARAWWSRHRPV